VQAELPNAVYRIARTLSVSNSARWLGGVRLRICYQFAVCVLFISLSPEARTRRSYWHYNGQILSALVQISRSVTRIVSLPKAIVHLSAGQELGMHTFAVFTSLTAVNGNGPVPSKGFEWYFYGTVTAGPPIRPRPSMSTI
jgi:hypothetical protein